MRHHVHFPDPLPVFVGNFHAANGQDAGVRTEQVNWTDLCFDLFDQARDFCLSRHIDLKGDAVDFTGGCLGTGKIKVGADHLFCALGGKTDIHRLANTTSGPGDDDDFIF